MQRHLSFLKLIITTASNHNTKKIFYASIVLGTLLLVIWGVQFFIQKNSSWFNIMPTSVGRHNESPNKYYVAKNILCYRSKQVWLELSVCDNFSGEEIWKLGRVLTEEDEPPWIDQGFGQMQFIFWANDSSYVLFEIENGQLFKVQLNKKNFPTEVLTKIPNDIIYDTNRGPSPRIKQHYANFGKNETALKPFSEDR